MKLEEIQTVLHGWLTSENNFQNMKWRIDLKLQQNQTNVFSNIQKAAGYIMY